MFDDDDDDEEAMPAPMDEAENQAPHPLELELDPDRDDPALVELMYEAAGEQQTLEQQLEQSGMPFALLDADEPEATLLLSNDRYRSYAVTMTFVQVLRALVKCWGPLGLNEYEKDAIKAAMVMVRRRDSHTILSNSSGKSKRRGTCSSALAERCGQHAREHNVFIICLSAAQDEMIIRTWCNADLAPFHWLMLDSLCRSFQGVQAGPHLLDKEKILDQFASKGKKSDENVSAVMSLFNELDLL